MRLNAAFWLRLGWSVQLLLAVALGVATLASLTPGKAAEP